MLLNDVPPPFSVRHPLHRQYNTQRDTQTHTDIIHIDTCKDTHVHTSYLSLDVIFPPLSSWDLKILIFLTFPLTSITLSISQSACDSDMPGG